MPPIRRQEPGRGTGDFNRELALAFVKVLPAILQQAVAKIDGENGSVWADPTRSARWPAVRKFGSILAANIADCAGFADCTGS